MRRGPRRSGQVEPDTSVEPRVNWRIRVPRVLVIDDSGDKLGEFMTEDAIRLAEERGMDLVEVAPMARPPVCKIADYGRMKYERSKREAAARKNQVQVLLKEVKLRPKTDDHDMDVKKRHVHAFLDAGNKVKVTVRFRGRELAHRDIGAQQCLRIAESVKDVGLIETAPRMDGRQMFMILAPTKRPVPGRRKELPDDLPPDPDIGEDDDEDDDDLTGESEEIGDEVAEEPEEASS